MKILHAVILFVTFLFSLATAEHHASSPPCKEHVMYCHMHRFIQQCHDSKWENVKTCPVLSKCQVDDSGVVGCKKSSQVSTDEPQSEAMDIEARDDDVTTTADPECIEKARRCHNKRYGQVCQGGRWWNDTICRVLTKCQMDENTGKFYCKPLKTFQEPQSLARGENAEDSNTDEVTQINSDDLVSISEDTKNEIARPAVSPECSENNIYSANVLEIGVQIGVYCSPKIKKREILKCPKFHKAKWDSTGFQCVPKFPGLSSTLATSISTISNKVSMITAPTLSSSPPSTSLGSSFCDPAKPSPTTYCYPYIPPYTPTPLPTPPEKCTQDKVFCATTSDGEGMVVCKKGLEPEIIYPCPKGEKCFVDGTINTWGPKMKCREHPEIPTLEPTPTAFFPSSTARGLS